MNSQIAFLQWVKANHPQVLAAAVAKVQRRSALGGLGDDLLSDISFDPDTISASDDIAYSTAGASNPSAMSSSIDWSGIINSVAAAVPQVANSVVTSRAQLAAIQLNAQRAQQNLPLITGNSLLTGQGLSGSNGVLLVGLGLMLVVALASKGGSSAPARK